jgi:hypothetical protein
VKRVIVSVTVLISFLMSSAVLADAYGALAQARTAMMAARSWHAEVHSSEGRTIQMDFSAPDRYRIQATPSMTEVMIGNEVYIVQNGRTMKLPMGGMNIAKMTQQFQVQDDPEMKKTARDLGMQTLNGIRVHVYSYSVQGSDQTLYLDSDSLPVQSVIKNGSRTTVVTFSKFNESISIEAPAS